MPIEPTPAGLLARIGEFQPLRAFSQGGRYWDRVPQQLIRQGRLAEFLPPVEVENDDRGAYGRFHWKRSRRELLSRSKPIGARGIPGEQLASLKAAIAEFKLKPSQPGAQPQNRELIERFQLPDITQDPALYRLAGPWWDRRLQILWGCEGTRNSSLPASAAVAKLPLDRWYHLKRVMAALSLLPLFLLLAWALVSGLGNLDGLPARQAQAQFDEKTKAAAQADAAAANKDAQAKRAREIADTAQADALAAQREATRANAEKNRARQKPLGGRPSPGGPLAPALPLPKAPPPATPAASREEPAANNPSDTGGRTAPDPQAASRCQIVLTDQGEPQADGIMSVSLEVRTAANPPQPVAVETWHLQDQIVTGQDRLETNMKVGEHAVRAAIRDSTGKLHEVSAAVIVEPGKIIATPAKVSVKPR